MRYFKLFLISFALFFSLLTIVGLLFPSEVHISRAIDLPGQRRSSLMQWMKDPGLLRCWEDATGSQPAKLQQASDSSYMLEAGEDTRMQWIFHGQDGMITLQGRIDVSLGWLPWQRFQSLLMESRYGVWLESELEQFKKCLSSAQVASVSP